jgi:hypothetical protein
MKILTVVQLLAAKIGDVLGKMPGVGFEQGFDGERKIRFTDRFERERKLSSEPVFKFQGSMMLRDFLYLVNKWECAAGVYLTLLYVSRPEIRRTGPVDVLRKIDVYLSREVVDDQRLRDKRVADFDKAVEEQKRQERLKADPPAFLREFKVQERSGFWDAEGNSVKRGDWTPTHYKYVDGPARNGMITIWLVVGPQREVMIGNRTFFLQEVPPGCNIQGMVNLERPCVARLRHQARSVEG